MNIRFATREDVPLLLEFIQELAHFERLRHEVVATHESLYASLFGPRAGAEAIIAEIGDRPIGFAVFFHNFSTFLGKPGLYLEDLYVRPEARGQGVGSSLLGYLAELAVQRGCERLDWWVLDWNEDAVRFYTRIGAVPMSDWTVFRLTGKKLTELAEKNAARLDPSEDILSKCDPHLLRSIELARVSRDQGNHPFGAVLVTQDGTVFEACNQVKTADDPTEHPELRVVRDAIRALGTAKVAGSVLFASTEPCAMCTGALYWCGLREVHFGYSAKQLGELSGERMPPACQEILRNAEREVKVVGPYALAEAAEVHRGSWGSQKG